MIWDVQIKLHVYKTSLITVIWNNPARKKENQKNQINLKIFFFKDWTVWWLIDLHSVNLEQKKAFDLVLYNLQYSIVHAQCDPLNMAVCFWYFIKSVLYRRLHWTSHFLQGTRKTQLYLSGNPVVNETNGYLVIIKLIIWYTNLSCPVQGCVGLTKFESPWRLV